MFHFSFGFSPPLLRGFALQRYDVFYIKTKKVVFLFAFGLFPLYICAHKKSIRNANALHITYLIFKIAHFFSHNACYL